MSCTRAFAVLAAALIGACGTPAPPTASSGAMPVAAQSAAPSPAPVASPAVASGPRDFTVSGRQTQGGWVRGQAPAGTSSARLGTTPLTLDPQGRFFAAFDRDAGHSQALVAELADGREVEKHLLVTPRDWRIEHVNVARRPGGASEAYLARRAPELAAIAAARQVDTGAQGWRQDFRWPAHGRISGRFGAQRVYRGEPGAYHSGLDIAGGAGAPYYAPADGVVVLAAATPFSLEGYLLIIDHGQGLNSAFLHSTRLLVREGETVRQGQQLGTIGATGRATGPHLHWSLVWRGQRLDPLLFLPE
ncbi:MAG: peptidase [Citromicrobium sp.]|nr:MAG: peptidase [Citromicrobium sp.]